MYKYDIPYPKKGQFTLMYNGCPLNVSKNISYLRSKIKEHRNMMEEDGLYPSAKYEVVSKQGNAVYERQFSEGESIKK